MNRSAETFISACKFAANKWHWSINLSELLRANNASFYFVTRGERVNGWTAKYKIINFEQLAVNG